MPDNNGWKQLLSRITKTILPSLSQEDHRKVVAIIRDEREVMTPDALAASSPTNLSFDYRLIDRMIQEHWNIKRCHINIDKNAVGSVAYEITTGANVFSFGVFSSPPVEGGRQGRISENEFDFFGVFIEGTMNLSQLKRDNYEFLRNSWNGRTNSKSLGWSVANRSKRLFEYTIDTLAKGYQPDINTIQDSGGYIIRNAGYYGNGRHGTRSWIRFEKDHPLSYPYGIDLLSLFLLRIAAVDIVNAAAVSRSESSVPLDSNIQRNLGIGNGSGIGTVAALVRWPAWLSAYISVREICLAYTLSRQSVKSTKISTLRENLIAAEKEYLNQDNSENGWRHSPTEVAIALRKIRKFLNSWKQDDKNQEIIKRNKYIFYELAKFARKLNNPEALERLHSIFINLYPDIIREASYSIPLIMAIPREVSPEMSLGKLKDILHNRFSWALEYNLTTRDSRAYFWYRSEENGENRRGQTGIDIGEDRQTFIDVIGYIQDLNHCLSNSEIDLEQSVGEFLLSHPKQSLAISRVQLAYKLPFSEIQANFCDIKFQPSSCIRLLLSVMGLRIPRGGKHRWVRGVFFPGAPILSDFQ